MHIPLGRVMFPQLTSHFILAEVQLSQPLYIGRGTAFTLYWQRYSFHFRVTFIITVLNVIMLFYQYNTCGTLSLSCCPKVLWTTQNKINNNNNKQQQQQTTTTTLPLLRLKPPGGTEAAKSRRQRLAFSRRCKLFERDCIFVTVY